MRVKIWIYKLGSWLCKVGEPEYKSATASRFAVFYATGKCAGTYPTLWEAEVACVRLDSYKMIDLETGRTTIYG